MKIMDKQVLNKVFRFVLLLGLLFSLLSSEQIFAQQEAMRVGRYWCGVIDNGGTASYRYESGSWFPNDYNTQGPSMENPNSVSGSGFRMATTNWVDPLGNLIEKAVVAWSADSDYNWGSVVTEPMTNFVRWDLPLNYIIQPDDDAIENKQVEPWGVTDASKMVGTCDQVFEVKNQGPLGVEIHRKIFAWSQQYHDNYIVADITLTNKSGKTLTDFYLNIPQSFVDTRKAAGDEPDIENTITTSQRYSWNHYYGAREGDSLRIFYQYNADDPTQPGDQMGLPVYNEDGRLYAHEIHFFAIFHASGAPYTSEANDTDDFQQPKGTDVYSRVLLNLDAEDGNTNANRPNVFEYIAGRAADNNPMEGAFPGTFHQANNDELGDTSWQGVLPGLGRTSPFHARHATFGPYAEFKDGEKLHFVYVSGFAGLSMEKAKEVGEKWQANTLEEPPNLPDARTGYFPSNFAFATSDEMDLRKNRWLSTGIDSVHKTVSRAKWNYEHNWQVPVAPEPPHMYIQGTGEGAEIRWAAPEAEQMDGFYGYRIMRRVGREDTVFYDEIQRFTADQLTKEPIVIGDTQFDGYKFVDTNILWGAAAYYYVQAGVRVDANDSNAFPTSRGKVIWSGRVWSTSRLDISPERPIGTQLDQIRIVPNPYGIADSRLSGYGLDRDDPRLLMFFNLPAEVTIRVFTESGDLVRTIEHAPLSQSGLYQWDMLTNNQQAIASGIYIAVFETPAGEISRQKFIVVR
jgi:hypothetical protein